MRYAYTPCASHTFGATSAQYCNNALLTTITDVWLGASSGGGSARPKPPSLPWMSTKAWDQLLAYEATLGSAFAGLPAALESAPADWKVSIAAHFASLNARSTQCTQQPYVWLCSRRRGHTAPCNTHEPMKREQFASPFWHARLNQGKVLRFRSTSSGRTPQGVGRRRRASHGVSETAASAGYSRGEDRLRDESFRAGVLSALLADGCGVLLHGVRGTVAQKKTKNEAPNRGGGPRQSQDRGRQSRD